VAQAKCPSMGRTSLCCAASIGVADLRGGHYTPKRRTGKVPVPLLRWLELGFGGVGVDGVQGTEGID
jgi:hypothetical protein